MRRAVFAKSARAELNCCPSTRDEATESGSAENRKNAEIAGDYVFWLA
jgi:hypothetical protein